MDPTEWNRRYAGSDLVWSAEPNRFLPPEVAGLTAARAIDLACGEGRNAIWLARHGWHVVGVDFAEAGVQKAQRLASDAGVAVHWVVADVTTYEPPRTFDLVIVFYLQLPEEAWRAALERAAGAAAPDGTVLVVGHHVDNLEDGYGGPTSRGVLHDPELIAGRLTDHGLAIERAERVERPVDTADGRRVALDSLVRARRPARR
jgi:SAM-dependent methyltransferase